MATAQPVVAERLKRKVWSTFSNDSTSTEPSDTSAKRWRSRGRARWPTARSGLRVRATTTPWLSRITPSQPAARCCCQRISVSRSAGRVMARSYCTLPLRNTGTSIPISARRVTAPRKRSVITGLPLSNTRRTASDTPRRGSGSPKFR